MKGKLGGSRKFQMQLNNDVDPIVSMEIVIMGLCCLKKTPYKMSKLQREKKTIIGPCP